MAYPSDSPLPFLMHEQMYANTNALLQARVKESPHYSIRTRESLYQDFNKQPMVLPESQEQFTNQDSKRWKNSMRKSSTSSLSLPDLSSSTEKTHESSFLKSVSSIGKAEKIKTVQTQLKPINMASATGYDITSAKSGKFDSISIDDAHQYYYPTFEHSQKRSESVGKKDDLNLNFNQNYDVDTDSGEITAYETTLPPFSMDTFMVSFARLNNFRDTSHPYNSKDIPMYFHIPKAGGSTVKDIIGSCFRMVMASEFGVTDGHNTDLEIAVVYPKVLGGTGVEERSPFVNVDVTTATGIERAVRMGFAESGLAGLVASPLLYEANKLFARNNQGRLFAIFRHPVDRAVSMFYYIQIASWGKNDSMQICND
jgi:hypothetical protein